MHAYIHAHRREAGLDDRPFELVVGGSTPTNAATAHDILGPLADAGATWWDERFPIDELGKFDAVRARIEHASRPGVAHSGQPSHTAKSGHRCSATRRTHFQSKPDEAARMRRST